MAPERHLPERDGRADLRYRRDGDQPGRDRREVTTRGARFDDLCAADARRGTVGGLHQPVWRTPVRHGADELREKLTYLQNAVGGVPGPFDSFLTLRGIKTLALRMERHCANAMAIAQFLASHPKVERVIYPGLASHPHHELAKRQMHGGFGGIISAVLRGGVEDARRFLERCHLFALAESLGGVESLVAHPATMTHASMNAEARRAAGITDGLLRLSIGLEAEVDLIADLEQAFIAAREVPARRRTTLGVGR